MTDTRWMQLKSITLHDASDEPPDPWPDGASAEYAGARLALEEAEAKLREQIRDVTALRHALPAGAVMGRYTLAEGPRDLEQNGPARPVTLVDLFGDHDALVVYHLMFRQAGHVAISPGLNVARGVLRHWKGGPFLRRRSLRATPSPRRNSQRTCLTGH